VFVAVTSLDIDGILIRLKQEHSAFFLRYFWPIDIRQIDIWQIDIRQIDIRHIDIWQIDIRQIDIWQIDIRQIDLMAD